MLFKQKPTKIKRGTGDSVSGLYKLLMLPGNGPFLTVPKFTIQRTITPTRLLKRMEQHRLNCPKTEN